MKHGNRVALQPKRVCPTFLFETTDDIFQSLTGAVQFEFRQSWTVL